MISRFLAIASTIMAAAYFLKWGYGFLQGGPEVGGDFRYFWVASSLALSGDPATVYDLSSFPRELAKVTGGRAFWFYPPTSLLMVLPLSLLPYRLSLAAWIAITLGGNLQVVRRIAPHPLTLWLTLAFPGTLLNLAYGQNGFLSAALLGGGLLLLPRFPFLSGLLFGLFSYKPQLAALVPVALIAGRHWRTLGATLISFGFLALASVMVLGWETWEAFFRNIPLAVKALGTEKQGWKMTSVFFATLLAGGSLSVATTLQGAVMLAALGAVSWVWFQGGSLALRGSVLTLGALLFTPHTLEYNLTLLALPLAWLGWEGHTKGWLPGERIFLFIGWFSPLFCNFLAKTLGLQPAPLVLATLLFLVLRRREGAVLI